TGREGSERREWAVRVRPPHPPPLRKPAPPPPVQVASAQQPAPAAAPPPRVALPLPRAAPEPAVPEVALVRSDPVDQDVRRWLERYAAAWRAHDVEALRRMGQVTNDREA